MKKSKSRYSYDALVKFLDGFFGDENAIPVFLEAVVLMYKRLLDEKRQDLMLPLHDFDVFGRVNDDFEALVDCHDGLSSIIVRRKFTTVPEYRDLSNKVYGRIGKKVGKRVKKKTSCIIKCVKKVIQSRALGMNDKELIDVFYAFHFSIREALINIRMTLKPDWFGAIPDSLTIILEKGDKVRVVDLFEYDEFGQKYIIRSGKLTRDELIVLQTSIVKFYFKKTYPQFS